MATSLKVPYHGQWDADSGVYRPRRTVETKVRRDFIVRERELSYRLYTHLHPYTDRLMQALLRQGMAGLQAIDTQYVGDNTSLPGSLKIALHSPATSIDLPAGSRFTLLDGVRVTLPDGTALDLEAGLQLKAGAGAQATMPDGMLAYLVAGMTGTPAVGKTFAPPPNNQAILTGAATIRLGAGTPVRLHSGGEARLAADTEALLASDTRLRIPGGVEVMLLDSRRLPELYTSVFAGVRYRPTTLVQRPYPVKDLDFTYSGAYSVYNWELFFHVPLTMAIHLSKNQRFAEAQRWFHYLFDPTDSSDGPTPERFWKVRPFQETDVKKVERLLVNLATGEDEELRAETIRSIEAWQEAPFRPHIIARYRQSAYMLKTVMAYLDNLIAWGDSLFRQDTGEAIDEALQVYVLAANILGPRPQPVPVKGTVRPQTYAHLRQDLRQFGTVLREVEAAVGMDLAPFPGADGANQDRLGVVRSLGKALYFAVPRNDKLMDYWDTVADRLFKIRNSLNIQGVFRQLALFEPPIDPALLARAAAAGVDVGAIVNGLNQPLPLVRFGLLVQKASEMAQEVKSLGNSLLSAMEKEDGEAMALLRSRHERAVLVMAEQVRYAQVQEAKKSKEGLIESLALAVQRYTYYERQLDKKPDEIEKVIPQLGELDKDSLVKMKFAQQEPALRPREIETDISGDLLGRSGGRVISSYEANELTLLDVTQILQDSAAATDLTASILAAIPSIRAHATPMGAGGSVEFGGQHLMSIFSAIASGLRGTAGRVSFEASLSAKIGGYARREQDWAFQANLAAGEINQIYKQLRAAEIREAIAEQELKSHRQQMRHAEEIERFLNEEGVDKTGKKTNKALYAWMKREVKGLYAQVFQFAFDIAKKAERALQHELGDPSLTFLQYGYLAGKEGLLAGDKLYFDIKRMEMAYHDLNQREYELTKHVSLQQVDPLALIRLRTTGKCTVRLPETLFDMDGLGHYFRRIKSVALSIPCVTGPYAGVNCKLTLQKSSIRQTSVVGDEYARADAEDPRFSDYFGSLQSIVTSSAQNDSGLFETNLRDERYLPFENSGVISEWQLELPGNPSQDDPTQFDYDTISDVILHLRYTAREGGEPVRRAAIANLKTAIEQARAAGSVRLISVRHEFPSEWARFKGTPLGDGQTRAELALPLAEHHYPFWSRGQVVVTRVDLFAQASRDLEISNTAADGGNVDSLSAAPEFGKLRVGQLSNIPLPPSTGTVRLFVDNASIDDLWLAVTWGQVTQV